MATSHPLKQRIDRLRWNARLLGLLAGVARVLAAVIGAIIVLGGLDYLIRFQDPGIRVLSSLFVGGLPGALLAVTVGVFAQFV